MTGDPYRDKGLNTGLASWAQLRHDTILNVKQSYTSNVAGTGGEGPPPKQAAYYVEPIPEVYARLGDLARLTHDGLLDLNLLPADLEGAFSAASSMFDSLKEISLHELDNLALTDSERDYVDLIDANMQAIVTYFAAGDPTKGYQLDSRDGLKTSIIADVHTDTNLMQVLEVASGRVDWLVVVNRLPDGTLMAAVGPILTYYEFAHDMKDRLTDEQWRNMLDSSQVPSRPTWTQGFYPSP